MNKFTLKEFSLRKRDSLLDYKIYQYNFDEMIEGFSIVEKSLSKKMPGDGNKSLYNAASQLQQRAWDSLVFLTNCYSGGHLISDLSKIYSTILEYWKSYSDAWVALEESEKGASNPVATVPLLGEDFSFANQLICFSVLLGLSNELGKISSIIDFNNPRRDGMLERLLNAFVDNRGEPPADCIRHLPYFKTLRIFFASRELRPQLMAEYLGDWYQASKREPYYDSHKRGDQFTGYWSWEAAAITFLLDIDDTAYRDAKFYPADLVEFARSIGASRSSKGSP